MSITEDELRDDPKRVATTLVSKRAMAAEPNASSGP